MTCAAGAPARAPAAVNSGNALPIALGHPSEATGRRRSLTGALLGFFFGSSRMRQRRHALDLRFAGNGLHRALATRTPNGASRTIRIEEPPGFLPAALGSVRRVGDCSDGDASRHRPGPNRRSSWPSSQAREPRQRRRSSCRCRSRRSHWRPCVPSPRWCSAPRP